VQKEGGKHYVGVPCLSFIKFKITIYIYVHHFTDYMFTILQIIHSTEVRKSEWTQKTVILNIIMRISEIQLSTYIIQAVELIKSNHMLLQGILFSMFPNQNIGCVENCAQSSTI
jgi:hypothetical protein